MSKNEFMFRLKNSLVSLNEKDKEDVLEDFEEHFNDALAMGKSEEEICCELGNPEDIGKIYNEEIKNEKHEHISEEFKNNDEGDLQTIKEIEIDIYSYDVDVIFENREDIFEDSSDDLFVKVIEGNKLTISLKHVQRTQRRYNFFNISSMFNGGELKVYIPTKFKNNLIIKSGSGDIRIINDCNLENLDIYAASGDVRCESLYVKNLNIKVESGDINIRKVIGENMSIYSTSGDISIYNACSSITIKSISGDIHLNINELKGNINMSMISGDGSIKLPQDSSFMFDVKTVSGDIRCRFPSNESCGYVGSHHRGTVGDGKYNINALSTSGDISLSY